MSLTFDVSLYFSQDCVTTVCMKILCKVKLHAFSISSNSSFTLVVQLCQNLFTVFHTSVNTDTALRKFFNVSLCTQSIQCAQFLLLILKCKYSLVRDVSS